MLEPKEGETKVARKISLAKTFDFTGHWRPSSRAHHFFEKKPSVSAHTHYKAASLF